jgi:hypothetical protein
MSKIFANPHKILLRLVGLNIAFDVLSIPLWIALSFMTNALSTPSLSVDNSIAIVDAATAATLFAVAFVGIIRSKKWGSYLAVVTTLGQRVAGYFIFGLNAGMAIEIVWSILIIYFACKAIQQPAQTPKPADSVQ